MSINTQIQGNKFNKKKPKKKLIFIEKEYN